MSLSKNPESGSNLTGKVVMGLHSPGPGEMTIQELEGKRRLLWDDSIDDEYLERVKAKAKEKAKEIMILAELEAEALRATAKHEGYEEGLRQAQEELDQHTQAMSAEVENILSQIQAHGLNIYNDRKADVLGLIRLAVEKTLNVEMTESRTQSLEALMQEALDRIESQRKIAVRCAAEDAPDLEAFIGTIQERNPDLKRWVVMGDPALAAGGVVVEAADGRVDNSVVARWQGVEPIFDQLATQLVSEEG